MSVVLVTEPFLDLGEGAWRGTFDHVDHFKDHFVVELDKPVTAS